MLPVKTAGRLVNTRQLIYGILRSAAKHDGGPNVADPQALLSSPIKGQSGREKVIHDAYVFVYQICTYRLSAE